MHFYSIKQVSPSVTKGLFVKLNFFFTIKNNTYFLLKRYHELKLIKSKLFQIYFRIYLNERAPSKKPPAPPKRSTKGFTSIPIVKGISSNPYSKPRITSIPNAR